MKKNTLSSMKLDWEKRKCTSTGIKNLTATTLISANGITVAADIKSAIANIA